jgi:hypothetical protein
MVTKNTHYLEPGMVFLLEGNELKKEMNIQRE